MGLGAKPPEKKISVRVGSRWGEIADSGVGSGAKPKNLFLVSRLGGRDCRFRHRGRQAVG